MKRNETTNDEYRNLIDLMNDAVFIFDLEGNFLTVNETAVEHLRYSRETLLSMCPEDSDAPKYAEKVLERIKDLEGDETLVFETVYETKKGEKIPVEVSSRLITYQGEPAILSVARDITEWKKLEKRQSLYSASLDRASIGVFWITPDGRFVYSNQALQERLGYSEEELRDMHVSDIDPNYPRERREEQWEKIKEHGTLTFESTHETSEGENIPVKITSHYMTHEGNEYEFAFIEDITERKKAEEELRKSRRTYQELFDKSAEAFFVHDPDTGEILNVNQKMCEMYGYSREEALEITIGDGSAGQHPYTQVEARKKVRKVKTKGPQTFEWRAQKKDGTLFWVEVALKQAKIGGEKKILASVRDITERKKNRQKLEALHNWAQRLNKANTMEDIFEYTLDAMEQTLGFKHASIQVKQGDILKLAAARGFQTIPEEIQELPLQGKGVTVDAATTGSTILINNVENCPGYHQVAPSYKSELAVPIKIEEQVFGVLNVESTEQDGFDRQDQQLLETLASHVAVAMKELQEKQKRVSLERIDELRNQFLAMAGHEINTPLTPIKTKLEMLQQEYFGELTESQQRQVMETLASVERLTRLVNDFRRASKLRAVQIELNKKRHQVVDTIEKALEQYKDVIAENDIALVKQFKQPLPAVYDEDRMIQVVRNLVENAIDYTDDKIWIHGTLHEDHIQLSVRDNGIGIPDDEQDKIFEPFYRVETEGRSRDDRQFGGTGLGLHICKRIIEAHGGTIHVDSNLGAGSTFTVTLPQHGSESKLPAT